MVSLSKVRETTVRAAGASKSPGSTPRATTNNPATPYTQSCCGQRPRISRTSGIDRLGDAHIDPGAELPENDIGQSFRRAYLRTTSVRRRQPTQIDGAPRTLDRKSTRLNSSHPSISYAVFCLKKKKKTNKAFNDKKKKKKR